MKTAAGLLFALFLGTTAMTQARAGDVVVATAQGRLVGVEADGLAVFKGVPYAAPPVGALRWAPPLPAAAWSGDRPAKVFGAQCPQTPSQADAGVGPGPFSEDCLTLNVWAPRPVGGRRVPVMVWLHGGGFISGSGSAPLYDGTALARRGVMVVTLNYRLGRLGFFAHPALTAAGGPLANYALMDQIAALRWVHRNARRLGGDPGAVTLFGESAGGWAVNRLMLAPQARGLFQRAIVQSGLGRERPRSLGEAEREGAGFVAGLGRPDATPAELRALPVDALLSPEPSIYRGFGPILDGSLVTGGVVEGFEAGRQAAVPYLIGFNGLEFPHSLTGGRLDRLLPTLTAAERDRAAAAYGGEATFRQGFLSDVLFVEPAVALASAQARRGAATWLYRFDAAPAAVRAKIGGAPHASERAYVFGNLARAAWPTGPVDVAVSEAMAGAWIAFARSGDPGASGRRDWPRVAYPAPALVEFTRAGPAIRPADALSGYVFVRDLRAATPRPG